MDVISGYSLVDDLDDSRLTNQRIARVVEECEGLEQIGAEAAEIAAGPLLPELVLIANAASASGLDIHAAETLIEPILEGLLAADRPMVLLYLGDALAASESLSRLLGRRLESALLQKYLKARGDGDGELSYRSLEILLRLALAGYISEHRLLAELLDLRRDDPPQLVGRLARLLGVAYSAWPDVRLVAVIEDLAAATAESGDYYFEIALIRIQEALSLPSEAEIVAGLRAAKDILDGLQSEEARDDALLYASALDGVFAFVGEFDANHLAAIATEMERAARLRRSLSAGMHASPWLWARASSEVAWYNFAAILNRAATYLAKPSWMKPVNALNSVLDAYSAERLIGVIPGGPSDDAIATLVKPKIEATFLRKEGLYEHLVEGLDEDDTLATREEAGLLIERIQSLRSRGEPGGVDQPGKVLAVAPTMAAKLGYEIAAELIEGVSIESVQKIDKFLADHDRLQAAVNDPLFDSLYTSIISDLESCPDFDGQIRLAFEALLQATVAFLYDRSDIGSSTGGERVSYLFSTFKESSGKDPKEKLLQSDYREWLAAGPLRRVVETEVVDIASGRADVKVGFGGLRFLAEIKREGSSVTREDLRKNYGGQAAAYAGTSASLGLLLVLDLTDQSFGFPSVRDSIWVDRVPVVGGRDRYLVVGVVRANRTVPSSTKGPRS